MAVRVGILPTMRDGLLTTPVEGCNEDCVATDDAEFERVGDEGRCGPDGAKGGGDEAANKLFELRCWLFAPLEKRDVIGAGVF